MSNGCGCEKGILKYFKPPYAQTFYAPCCMHDDAYDKGGGRTERLAADKLLFANMTRKIARSNRSPIHCLWMTFVAYAYYVAVRLLGWKYFNYND